jgi:hypothetical protein
MPKVLECASAVALWWGVESGAGPPHSKTLPRLAWPLVRFMVPMHAKKRQETLHEPEPGLRRFWSAPVPWSFSDAHN